MFCFFSPQVHVLGVGLAVHEKLVHPEMRPLHKKLIDQFQMMRSSLCHVSAAKLYYLQSSGEKNNEKNTRTNVVQKSFCKLFMSHNMINQN